MFSTALLYLRESTELSISAKMMGMGKVSTICTTDRYRVLPTTLSNW